MAPAWPSSEVSKGQGEQLPGSGGILASRPPVKSHSPRDQGPEDDRIRRKNQRRRGKGIEARRYLLQVNLPGANSDLGAGRERQREGGHGHGNGVRHRHAAGAQKRAANDGGCRVRATSRWATLRSGRGGGERVQAREVFYNERLRIRRL